MQNASETAPPRRVLRSIGAVVAGLILIVILSTGTDQILHAREVFPRPGQPMATWLWVLATAYRIVYSIAGCYLAARLAPDRPMRHAIALGIVGVVISTVGAAVTWHLGPGFGPKWYPISLAVVALPCGWMGGWLAGGRAATNAA